MHVVACGQVRLLESLAVHVVAFGQNKISYFEAEQGFAVVLIVEKTSMKLPINKA